MTKIINNKSSEVYSECWNTSTEYNLKILEENGKINYPEYGVRLTK